MVGLLVKNVLQKKKNKMKLRLLQEDILNIDKVYLNKTRNAWKRNKNKFLNVEDPYGIFDLLEKLFNRYGIEISIQKGSHDDPYYKKAGIVGGWYDDERKIIVIAINLKKVYEVVSDKNTQEIFYKAFERMFTHEYIHKKQTQKMPQSKASSIVNKEMDKRGYLSSKYEIMAFAHEIVSGLKELGYDKNQILQLLKYPQKSRKTISYPLYRYYKKIYETDKKSFNRLLSQAYQYANEI